MHVGRLTALGADRLLHLLPRCIQDVPQHHAGAFLREEPRFGRPLAPGPATNQCDFAFQSPHGSLPSATRWTTRAILLPICCQGSTSAHPVNPALLWPKAARDGSAHGGHPAVAAGTPGSPPALGLACPERTASPLRHAPPDFLLSSGSHMRYTYAQAAVPIPTPSSARLSGLGRVGDDL